MAIEYTLQSVYPLLHSIIFSYVYKLNPRNNVPFSLIVNKNLSFEAKALTIVSWHLIEFSVYYSMSYILI